MSVTSISSVYISQVREWCGTGKFDKIRLLQALKSLVVVVGGRESDYSVCPRPLLQFLQFLQFFQFMSDRLHQVTQVTSGYVSLRRRDGTWSSTKFHNFSLSPLKVVNCENFFFTLT